MRLAVSNLAWPRTEDPAVRDRLMAMRVQGLEVAPTVVWPDPRSATRGEVKAYRLFWESAGLPIVALQAILFGRSDLVLFRDEETRGVLRDHLVGMMRLGSELGAGVLVFGAPKNRLVGGLGREEAEVIALPFFRSLGDEALRYGVTIGLEPNPVAYGCDFLTTAQEGLAFVQKVDHPGIRLHLDSGAMHLAGDEPGAAVSRALPWLCHVHLSEPDLVPIGTGGVDQQAMADALRQAGYERWVSLEMRPLTGPRVVEGLAAAVAASLPPLLR